jgi:hypothetical protein
MPAQPASGPGPIFTLAGFSDHTAPNNTAPPDVVPPGGTLRSYNPATLYAFVRIDGLTTARTVAVTWYADDQQISVEANNVTLRPGASGLTMSLINNASAPTRSAVYSFKMTSGGPIPEAEGAFTLTC